MSGNKGVKICAGVAAICAIIALILVLTLPRPFSLTSGPRESTANAKESAIDAASLEALKQEAAYRIVQKKEKEYNLGCLSSEYIKCAKLVVRAENNPGLAGALRYAAAKNVRVMVNDSNYFVSTYGSGWVVINLNADDNALIQFLVGK